jgi:hypothetical protein
MKSKFFIFAALVLFFMGLWLIYVTRATMTIEACTEKGSDVFQVYWMAKDGQFSENASAKLTINEQLSKRTVKIGNLKDILLLRVDPLRGEGSVKIRSIEISQLGFATLLYTTADDFKQFFPWNQITKTSDEDNVWTIDSSGSDPYLLHKITPVACRGAFLTAIFQYLLIFGVLSILLVALLHYLKRGIAKLLEQKEDFPSDGSLVAFFKKYKNIIFLALAVRIIIMPFFAHDDLAAEMWRSYNILHGKWIFFNSLTWLTSVIHCATVYCVDLIIPDFAKLMPETGISIGFFKFDSEKFIEFWGPFASQAKFMVAVFLFKISYLIFDMLTGWYLCRLVPAGSRRTLIFWLFNPISIFSAYMWGRHDIIMVCFLVGSLFYLEEKQTGKSILFMLLATSVKPATIIILPLYFLRLLKGYKIKGSIIAAIIVFFVIGISLFPEFRETLHTRSTAEHLQYLIEMKLVTHHWSKLINDRIEIYLFPALIFTVTFLYSIARKEKFLFFATISFLSYFCFCYYHPHYMIWTVPFIVYFASNSSMMGSLFKALSATYIVYFFALRGFKLFLPLVNFTLNAPFDNFVTGLHKILIDDLLWAIPQMNFFMVTLLFTFNLLIMVYLIIHRKQLLTEHD